jgi:hypothetical protein
VDRTVVSPRARVAVGNADADARIDLGALDRLSDDLSA